MIEPLECVSISDYYIEFYYSNKIYRIALLEGVGFLGLLRATQRRLR